MAFVIIAKEGSEITVGYKLLKKISNIDNNYNLDWSKKRQILFVEFLLTVLPHHFSYQGVPDSVLSALEETANGQSNYLMYAKITGEPKVTVEVSQDPGI